MSDEFQGSTHKSPADGDNVTSTPLSVSVLILWENVASASAAKQICREMEEVGQLPAWRDSMWKFDLLSMRGFCEMAGREAAEADWIIVAFEGDSELPEELQQWLKTWRSLASKKSQSIIALSVSPPFTDTGNTISTELRAFAFELGCAFRIVAGGTGKDSKIG